MSEVQFETPPIEEPAYDVALELDDEVTEEEVALEMARVQRLQEASALALGVDTALEQRRNILRLLRAVGQPGLVPMGKVLRLQVTGAEAIARILGITVGDFVQDEAEFGFYEDGKQYMATYRVTVTDGAGAQHTEEGHANTTSGMTKGHNAADPSVRAVVRAAAQHRAVTKAVGHMLGVLYVDAAELAAATGDSLFLKELSAVTYREGAQAEKTAAQEMAKVVDIVERTRQVLAEHGVAPEDVDMVVKAADSTFDAEQNAVVPGGRTVADLDEGHLRKVIAPRLSAAIKACAARGESGTEALIAQLYKRHENKFAQPGKAAGAEDA